MRPVRQYDARIGGRGYTNLQITSQHARGSTPLLPKHLLSLVPPSLTQSH